MRATTDITVDKNSDFLHFFTVSLPASHQIGIGAYNLFISNLFQWVRHRNFACFPAGVAKCNLFFYGCCKNAESFHFGVHHIGPNVFSSGWDRAKLWYVLKMPDSCLPCTYKILNYLSLNFLLHYLAARLWFSHFWAIFWHTFHYNKLQNVTLNLMLPVCCSWVLNNINCLRFVALKDILRIFKIINFT